MEMELIRQNYGRLKVSVFFFLVSNSVRKKIREIPMAISDTVMAVDEFGPIGDHFFLRMKYNNNN